MAQKASGYGRKWKKWLGIYLVIGAVVYFAIYLLLLHHGGGAGGGGFRY